MGDIAHELHRHKANRKAVLPELARTLDLGKPSVAGVSKQVTESVRVRDRLNRYVEELHTPTREGKKMRRRSLSWAASLVFRRRA